MTRHQQITVSESETEVRVAGAGTIAAPVDRVFPLCCPVEEYRWIPGWRCELVHCPHGRVELGCVFREVLSAPFLMGTGRGKTTWTAVVHDPAEHRVHFRLDNAVSSSLYRIELAADGAGATRCALRFDYRATTERGRALVARGAAGRIAVMLGLLAEMLGHYAERGEMIPFASVVRRVVHADELALHDKVRLAQSQLAMWHLRDPDRARFFSRPA